MSVLPRIEQWYFLGARERTNMTNRCMIHSAKMPSPFSRRSACRLAQAVFCMENLEQRRLMSTYVVTVGGDGTTGHTLRWAVGQVNINNGGTIDLTGESGTINLTQTPGVLELTSSSSTAATSSTPALPSRSPTATSPTAPRPTAGAYTAAAI